MTAPQVTFAESTSSGTQHYESIGDALAAHGLREALVGVYVEPSPLPLTSVNAWYSSDGVLSGDEIDVYPDAIEVWPVLRSDSPDEIRPDDPRLSPRMYRFPSCGMV